MDLQATKEKQLSISEIKLSEALSRNRIDAEFYDPEYLHDEKLIEKKGYKEVISFASVTDGIHASIDFDEESNINLISAMSPKDNYFDLSRNKNISEAQHKKNPRTELRENDVIVSTVGTIGNCAVVDKSILPANSDRHVGIIRINSDYLPHFLSTFLLSKYGKFQTIREATGNVQLNLFIEKIETLKIPIVSDIVQKAVSDTVKKALSLREQSRISYKEAEQLLLKDTGLISYKPSEENTSVRSITDCLLNNRFDAEYWQIDFDKIIKQINSYKEGISTIANEFEPLKNNFRRTPTEIYNYIEIGDVDISTGFADHTEIIGSELPANAKIKLGKRQLITSKVRPNRGATAILEEHEGYIASGAFTVLKEKGNLNLETLMIYLKTQPIRELLLRYNTGTSYPTITDNDILNLPIPLVKEKIQKQISTLISSSARNRIIAQGLFDRAKTAVEVYIEQGEKQALSLLK